MTVAKPTARLFYEAEFWAYWTWFGGFADGRGFSNQAVIDAVKQTGRNPDEAVIAAPFQGRNPWRVAVELNLLLDECKRWAI